MESLLEAFRPFEPFCKAMLDAYVLLDPSGRVVKCNQLFSAIVGVSSKQVLKAESFDQLLSLSVDGSRLQIAKLLEHKTSMRMDEISGATQQSHHFNLILGSYPFFAQDQFLGLFLLIRDVTAETNLQGKYKDKATQSITDRLTGLYNRTYFETYLGQMETTIQDKRRAPQVSILMCDIDHFKKVNDTHGHQAGDFILAEVSKLFRESFRKTDILCRYGGEEFLAILPSTDISGALLVAEKLRSKIAGFRFSFHDLVIPTTISIGVANVRQGIETPAQTVTRADEALYFSKEQGRNRVSLHDGEQLKVV
jgi:diguanylate cyclase (GGDEF)-like protein/PAS domain S-box-containing protein